MRAILVTGVIGSGKDTAVKYLLENYVVEGAKFAAPIKDIGMYLFGWNTNHSEGNMKEVKDEFWGISPREFFQLFGTDIMQKFMSKRVKQFKKNTGRKIWAKILAKKYEKGQLPIVVSDCRFPHELDTLRQFGYDVEVIKITRNKTPWYKKLFWHESEKAIDKIKAGYTVSNTGTIEELYSAIDHIAQHLGLVKK